MPWVALPVISALNLLEIESAAARLGVWDLEQSNGLGRVGRAAILGPLHRHLLVAEEEQDLMNKEFALQFHRDLVLRAESQFAECAMRFDQANMRQGSPRRARFL